MGTTRLYLPWKDLKGVVYETYITPVDGYIDTYTVHDSLENPVTLSYNGGDKNNWDDIVIQGRELMINFALPRADVDVLDPLFDSEYKDYKVTYFIDSAAIFTGWLKPENLYKRFETNPPNIEIEMSATDGLADLKEIKFKVFDNTPFPTVEAYTGRKTILEVVKYALEHIELPFDFKIQLGTYEVDNMQSDHCALAFIYVFCEAFITTTEPSEFNKEESLMSCWDVIEYALKDFNVKLKQHRGYYYITNYHERESREFTYGWTNLNQASVDNAISPVTDITDYLFREYIEQQKIHPLAGVLTTFQSKGAVGEEADITGFDLKDWATYWDMGFPYNSGDPATGILTLRVYKSQFEDSAYTHELELKTSFYVTYLTSNDYLSVQLNYELLMESVNTVFGDKLPIMQLGIQICTPADTGGAATIWQNTQYFPLYSGGPVSIQTPMTTPFKVNKSGYYSIRIKFIMDNEWVDLDWTSIEFRINSFLCPKLTTYLEYEGQTGDEAQPQIVYLQRNIKGYETLENDTMFKDSLDSREMGRFTAGISPVVNTQYWNCYNGALTYGQEGGGIHILDLYARNILMNRSRYKNFLRCTIIDRDHAIDEHHILTIQGLDYVISSFTRNYRDGQFEVELVELVLTTDLGSSGTSPSVGEGGLDDYNPQEELEKSGTIPDEGTDETLEEQFGHYQPAHGLSTGDIIRAEEDSSGSVIYVKAQADVKENAKAIGIVSEVLSVDRFKYISEGYITYDTDLYVQLALEEGEYYFLSTTTAGAMIPSYELGVNDIEQCIGFCTSKGFKVEIDARNLEYPGTTVTDLLFTQATTTLTLQQSGGLQDISVVLQGVGGGTQGTQGIQGLQGESIQGVQGIAGEFTAQGIQGIQGVQGVQGEAIQGVQGLDGEYAAQGIQGIQGVQGIQGIQGEGIQGVQGTDGSQGTEGTGVQGSQGVQGIQGTEIQGIQGAAGSSQGIQGIQGADGLQGADGSGSQGVQGTDGLQGTRGSVIRAGETIPYPFTPAWEGDYYLDQDTNQLFGPIDGTGLADYIYVTGSQGVQGLQGEAIQGTDGIQGIQGIQGLGEAGSQGTQGVQGLDGSGGQGTQGVQGIQGITGAQGTQGLQYATEDAAFILLYDAPSSYSGKAGNLVGVNSGETALQFVAAPTSSTGIVKLLYTDETDSTEVNTTTAESSAMKTYTPSANTYTYFMIEVVAYARVEQDADSKCDFTWRIKEGVTTKRTYTQRIIAENTAGIDSGDRALTTFSTIIAGGGTSALTVTVQPNLNNAATGALVHAFRVYGII